MARPRKATDEEIYEAAFAIMGRVGPAQWTLDDVAREVGLTASALVQRFGSKRQLQLDLIRLYAEGAPALYAGLRERSSSPLQAVRAWAEDLACLAGSEEALANHLDYLRLDLTDPDMHVHFRSAAEAGRAFLREALADAVAEGELPANADLDALLELVEAGVTGSLFTWATYREGSARAWVGRHLKRVLANAPTAGPAKR